MKKVLLRYYNANNLGDDLFVKIITDRYENEFTLKKDVTSTFYRDIKNLKIKSGRLLNRIYRYVEKLLSKNNLYISTHAKSYDLLVYVGGSIFMENKNIPHWHREREFYSNLLLPYYILGSNFGPFENKGFLPVIRDIVSSAQDVCFRDMASYKIFEDIPTARLATDMVFSMDVSAFKKVNVKRKVVFSIIDGDKKFDKSMSDKYEYEIIELVKKLATESYEITLMSFCELEGDDDAIRRILFRVQDDLREKIKVYSYKGDINEALNVIAESELVVASRFHAVILGLLLQKKVLPMAYSNKTKDILRDLNFKGPVVDINRIDQFNGAAFDFNSLVYNDVGDQIVMAQLQFQELDKVLSRRV